MVKTLILIGWYSALLLMLLTALTLGFFALFFGDKAPKNRFIYPLWKKYYDLMFSITKPPVEGSTERKLKVPSVLCFILRVFIIGFILPYCIAIFIIVQIINSKRTVYLPSFQFESIAVIQKAMFIILTEQPRGVYPIIRPLSISNIPIQSVFYRGVNAFQLCVDKENVSTTLEEAEAFKLRLNAAIDRHLRERSFPGVLQPSEDGINPLFKVCDVEDRGLYWDISVIPGSCFNENHHKPTPLKPDMQDNDF